jgi:hypothetical protein
MHAALPDITRLVVLLGSQRRMAEVLRQKSQLFIALFLNTQRGIRIAPAETLRVVKLHLGRFRFFRAVQRAKQRGRRSERPVHAPLADIVEAFRKTFFDERLWSEDQAIAFQFNLQVIARRESQFVMKFLRNSDLPADPDLDNHSSPARFRLYFHIIIFYEIAVACQSEPQVFSIDVSGSNLRKYPNFQSGQIRLITRLITRLQVHLQFLNSLI